jgi:hypothetical protein
VELARGSREAALRDAEAEAGGGDQSAGGGLPERVDPERHDPEPGQRREGAPSRREPEVRVEPPAHQLQVVGQDQQRPGDDQRREAGGNDEQAGDADRQGAAEPGQRQRPQGAVIQAGAKWMPVQLVQRVGRDPDGQEEGAERRPQAHRMKLGRGRGAQRHVAQVPGRVRRVEERDEVAPSSAAKRVERGPIGDLIHRGDPT